MGKLLRLSSFNNSKTGVFLPVVRACMLLVVVRLPWLGDDPSAWAEPSAAPEEKTKAGAEASSEGKPPAEAGKEKPASGSPASSVPVGMVFVSAGEFVMGSTDEQVTQAAARYGGEYVYALEKPQRRVHVDAFYIDVCPITNKEFKEFLDATGYRPQGNRYQRMWFLRHWSDGTYPAGKADHPVTYITWFDTKAYSEWKGKRLPTEAEWEKAARGSDARLWPWGNEFDAEKANVRIWGQEHLADTTPVGSYMAGRSPFGCLDMAGNVFEWTGDLDPEELKKGAEVVVLKGGSWKSYDTYARCAFRQFAEAAGFGPHIGFRCAKSP